MWNNEKRLMKRPERTREELHIELDQQDLLLQTLDVMYDEDQDTIKELREALGEAEEIIIQRAIEDNPGVPRDAAIVMLKAKGLINKLDKKVRS